MNGTGGEHALERWEGRGRGRHTTQLCSPLDGVKRFSGFVSSHFLNLKLFTEILLALSKNNCTTDRPLVFFYKFGKRLRIYYREPFTSSHSSHFLRISMSGPRNQFTGIRVRILNFLRTDICVITGWKLVYI